MKKRNIITRIKAGMIFKEEEEPISIALTYIN
jgi:hypothetical protein